MFVVRNLFLSLDFIKLRANFEIAEGQSLLLKAASGFGKSTLIDAIGGFTPLTQGEVYLHQERIDVLPASKRNIGIVFQDQRIFEHLTVQENLEFALKVRDVTPSQRAEQSHFLSAQLGLDDLMQKSASTLSGGERQRLAILRALIFKPKLVIFDEAFSALDADMRTHTLTFLKQWQVINKTVFVLISHQESDAEFLDAQAIEGRESNGERMFIQNIK